MRSVHAIFASIMFAGSALAGQSDCSSDQAIALVLVDASRATYHATGAPCACPDDTNRIGNQCGRTSAYIRPGGYAPLCYPHDVTPARIEHFRSTSETCRK